MSPTTNTENPMIFNENKKEICEQQNDRASRLVVCGYQISPLCVFVYNIYFFAHSMLWHCLKIV